MLAKRPVVSSVRAEALGTHMHITIWTRGQSAGSIVVDPNDASELLVRLIPHGCQTIEGTRVTRWALAEAKVQRDGYTLTATQDDEDRNVVRIALNGESVDSVRWDDHRFDGYRFAFTPIEHENDEAREALEVAYAEALSHLPEPV